MVRSITNFLFVNIFFQTLQYQVTITKNPKICFWSQNRRLVCWSIFTKIDKTRLWEGNITAKASFNCGPVFAPLNFSSLCLCSPQPAFILRAAPLNCPHCSDLNVCAGLAEPVPPLFHPFYPPDLSVLLLAGFGLLIKRGPIKAFYTWSSKYQPGVRCLVKTRFGRVEPSPL